MLEKLDCYVSKNIWWRELSWLIYVVFFCQLVTDLSILMYELSLYSLCLFLPLYEYNIYLVFFSGDLIEGYVENKSLFFVVIVSLRPPKLRAAVMQKNARYRSTCLLYKLNWVTSCTTSPLSLGEGSPRRPLERIITVSPCQSVVRVISLRRLEIPCRRVYWKPSTPTPVSLS